MMKRITSGLAIAAMALAFVGISSARADAAFIAYICNDIACSGGGDVIVTDNGAGDVANTLDGQIVATGSVGGLTFALNSSESKPLIGSATSPSLDLSFQASGTATSNVYFYASDTDFTGAVTVNGTLDGNFAGTGLVQAELCGGTSNANLDTSNCDISSVFTTSPFHADFALGPLGAVNPYSLTLGFAIGNHSSFSSVSGDFLATSVPEPASMALFGLGLLGAGVVRRRRTAVR